MESHDYSGINPDNSTVQPVPPCAVPSKVYSISSLKSLSDFSNLSSHPSVSSLASVDESLLLGDSKSLNHETESICTSQNLPSNKVNSFMSSAKSASPVFFEIEHFKKLDVKLLQKECDSEDFKKLVDELDVKKCSSKTSENRRGEEVELICNVCDDSSALSSDGKKPINLNSSHEVAYKNLNSFDTHHFKSNFILKNTCDYSTTNGSESNSVACNNQTVDPMCNTQIQNTNPSVTVQDCRSMNISTVNCDTNSKHKKLDVAALGNCSKPCYCASHKCLVCESSEKSGIINPACNDNNTVSYISSTDHMNICDVKQVCENLRSNGINHAVEICPNVKSCNRVCNADFDRCPSPANEHSNSKNVNGVNCESGYLSTETTSLTDHESNCVYLDLQDDDTESNNENFSSPSETQETHKNTPLHNKVTAGIPSHHLMTEVLQSQVPNTEKSDDSVSKCVGHVEHDSSRSGDGVCKHASSMVFENNNYVPVKVEDLEQELPVQIEQITSTNSSFCSPGSAVAMEKPRDESASSQENDSNVLKILQSIESDSEISPLIQYDNHDTSFETIEAITLTDGEIQSDSQISNKMTFTPDKHNTNNGTISDSPPDASPISEGPPASCDALVVLDEIVSEGFESQEEISKLPNEDIIVIDDADLGVFDSEVQELHVYCATKPEPPVNKHLSNEGSELEEGEIVSSSEDESVVCAYVNKRDPSPVQQKNVLNELVVKVPNKMSRQGRRIVEMESSHRKDKSKAKSHSRASVRSSPPSHRPKRSGNKSGESRRRRRRSSSKHKKRKSSLENRKGRYPSPSRRRYISASNSDSDESRSRSPPRHRHRSDRSRSRCRGRYSHGNRRRSYSRSPSSEPRSRGKSRKRELNSERAYSLLETKCGSVPAGNQHISRSIGYKSKDLKELRVTLPTDSSPKKEFCSSKKVINTTKNQNTCIPTSYKFQPLTIEIKQDLKNQAKQKCNKAGVGASTTKKTNAVSKQYMSELKPGKDIKSKNISQCSSDQKLSVKPPDLRSVINAHRRPSSAPPPRKTHPTSKTSSLTVSTLVPKPKRIETGIKHEHITEQIQTTATPYRENGTKLVSTECKKQAISKKSGNNKSDTFKADSKGPVHTRSSHLTEKSQSINIKSASHKDVSDENKSPLREVVSGFSNIIESPTRKVLTKSSNEITSNISGSPPRNILTTSSRSPLKEILTPFDEKASPEVNESPPRKIDASCSDNNGSNDTESNARKIVQSNKCSSEKNDEYPLIFSSDSTTTTKTVESSTRNIVIDSSNATSEVTAIPHRKVSKISCNFTPDTEIPSSKTETNCAISTRKETETFMNLAHKTEDKPKETPLQGDLAITVQPSKPNDTEEKTSINKRWGRVTKVARRRLGANNVKSTKNTNDSKKPKCTLKMKPLYKVVMQGGFTNAQIEEVKKRWCSDGIPSPEINLTCAQQRRKRLCELGLNPTKHDDSCLEGYQESLTNLTGCKRKREDDGSMPEPKKSKIGNDETNKAPCEIVQCASEALDQLQKDYEKQKKSILDNLLQQKIEAEQQLGDTKQNLEKLQVSEMQSVHRRYVGLQWYAYYIGEAQGRHIVKRQQMYLEHKQRINNIENQAKQRLLQLENEYNSRKFATRQLSESNIFSNTSYINVEFPELKCKNVSRHTICLPENVAETMVAEDKLYDQLYSHREDV